MMEAIKVIDSLFKEICKENSLRYKKFNRNTVLMPIVDYYTLLNNASEFFPQNIELRDRLWMGGQIIDKNTTQIFTEQVTNVSSYSGVGINIYLAVAPPPDRVMKKKLKNDLVDLFVNAWLLDCYGSLSSFSSQVLYERRDFLSQQYPFKNFRNLLIYGPTLDSRNGPKSTFIDLERGYPYYQEAFRRLPRWEQQILRAHHNNVGKLYQYDSSLRYSLRTEGKKS